VFEERRSSSWDIDWLAQGTIYPDVIESAGAKTGKAHVIKSHHNVGGLPERMRMKLVEPLRELFKDEVRKIGARARPAAGTWSTAIPSRARGSACASSARCARNTPTCCARPTTSSSTELRAHDLYDQVSQAFAVFLPVRSVGVMGDGRRYDYVVALRAVETIDFMTARWAHLPYEFLDLVSRRIINEIAGISRVTYDISGKPPATIEWE
jgi:GMP synthase (glutamine-hydrolysing)